MKLFSLKTRKKPKIPLRHLADCLSSVAAFTSSGIALPYALEIMKDTVPSYEDFYKQLIISIQSGKTFSESLKPLIVASPLVFSMLAIGEQNGCFSDMAKRAALYIRKEGQVKSAILTALLYPAVIALALVVLVICLFVYMLPQIIPIFLTMGVELSFSTRILVWLYRLSFKEVLTFLAVVLFACFCIAKYFVKIKKYFSWQKIPFLSDKLVLYVRFRFFLVLSALLESGSTLETAISTASQSISSLPHIREVQGIAKKIQNGLSAHLSFKGSTLAFPEALALMRTGEETGTFPLAIATIRDRLEQSVVRNTELLLKFIEPAVMLVVGVLVAFLSIAIISPMYSLTSHLHG